MRTSYLLASNELRLAFARLEILDYQEVDDAAAGEATASLLARRPLQPRIG